MILDPWLSYFCLAPWASLIFHLVLPTVVSVNLCTLSVQTSELLQSLNRKPGNLEPTFCSAVALCSIISVFNKDIDIDIIISNDRNTLLL